MTSYEAEVLQNIKRNAKHGLAQAEKETPQFIDLFLHILNLIGEIEFHNHMNGIIKTEDNHTGEI